MSTPFEKEHTEALAALDAQDPQRAFSIFRHVLEYPGKLRGREDFVEALRVLAQIAQPVAGDELVEPVLRAAEEPDDPGALYELGYQLIEQNLHGIAATVLTRGLSFAPGQEGYVSELCAALEGSGRSAEACKVLREVPRLVEESFVCRYLLSFNAIMSGDLATAEGLAPGLAELVNPSDEGHVFMRSTVARMLARAHVIRGVARLDESALRGWHFVVTGGLLAHLSPYGLDAPMHGRYAFVQDAPERLVEGILRLEAILKAWQIAPGRLLYLPDRGSEILGLVAAQLLGLPATPWPAGGDVEPALIVAYDLADVDDDALTSLQERRDGQILFTHAACWTQPPAFAPDVLTLLYQMNRAPWGERLSSDPVTRETVTLPEDTRPAQVIARDIAAVAVEEGALDDLPALVALAEKTAPGDSRETPISSPLRGRFWASSPVTSNRFT